MKKSIALLLKIVIGLSILGATISAVGVQEVVEAFSDVRISLLVLSFSIEPIVQVFAGAIYKILLSHFNHDLPLLFLTRCASVSFAVGLISPGRVTELSILIPFKKKGVKITHGVTAFMADKYLTFLVLSLIGSLGILYFIGSLAFLIAITLLIFAFLSIYYILTSLSYKSIVQRYILKGRSESFHEFSKSFRRLLQDKKIILLAVLVKSLKWCLSFISVSLMFVALGFSIDPITVGMIFSAVALLSALPFTFSGIGVKEGSGAYFFNAFAGVPPAIATNAMLLSTAKNFLMGFIFYSLSSGILVKSDGENGKDKKLL